jgi:hypothetical protein
MLTWIPSVSLLLTLTWLLLALALAPYSPMATAWFFLSLQFYPLCFERIDRYYPNRNFSKLLFEEAARVTASDAPDSSNKKEKKKDRERRKSIDMPPDSGVAAGGGGGGGGGANDTNSVPNGIVVSQSNSLFVKFKKLLFHAKYRKEQSFIILCSYVIWVSIFAPENGKHVGAINACAIIVVDVIMNYLSQCPGVDTKSASIPILLVGAAVRATISCSGMETWFLGMCV